MARKSENCPLTILRDHVPVLVRNEDCNDEELDDEDYDDD